MPIVGVYQLRVRAQRAAGEPAPRRQLAVTAGRTGVAGVCVYRSSPACARAQATAPGFRAPTFNDLYFPMFSESALQPETARNFEAALRYANRQVNARQSSRTGTGCADLDRVRSATRDFNCAPQNVARRDARRRHARARRRSGDTTRRRQRSISRAPYDDATGNLLAAARAPLRQRSSVTQAVGAAAARRRRSSASSAALRRRGEHPAHGRLCDGQPQRRVRVAPRSGRCSRCLAMPSTRHYELAADYNTMGANVFGGVRYRY